MLVRSVSHAYPAGAVQRIPSTSRDSSQQIMGTPPDLAHETETAEPVGSPSSLDFEGPQPTIAAATHDAVTRLHRMT